MDKATLTSLGLTESQAKAYQALVQFGPTTPPLLATRAGEKRTNAYKILDRLVELGLATKNESAKKTTYSAAHPTALETLAKKHRNEALEQEKRVKNVMPNLLNFFYSYSEQPGVRFFQGKDGIKEIFDDMLRTHQDIYLVRSPADIEFYDEAFYDTFKKQRARLGIQTYALTPKLPGVNRDPKIDEANLFNRTWLPKDAYDGATEWNVYGNKLAIISSGEEAIGMIIESPLIAESFKQLFGIMRSANSLDAS